MFSRIYIHIPFCKRKCSYCVFVSRAGTSSEIERYVRILMAEIRLAARETPCISSVDSIYFGGGTPSLLEPSQMREILGAISNLYNIAADAEITLETNPGTADIHKFKKFRSAGINRLSIGVQSFNDAMLSALGRAHTVQQALSCMEAARNSGFDNVAIDLIHALHDQTLDMWRKDISQAVALAPNHISVYGLTIEEGTPFAALYAQNTASDDELSADMFEAAHCLLTNVGYEHYEISNYASPGFRSRHNCGYWKRDGYLGFGCAAHSFLRDDLYGARFSNDADLAKYSSSVTGGNLPHNDITRLSRDAAMEEFMFLGLRMADGVTFSSFKREFGASLEDEYGDIISDLAEQQLLTVDKNGAHLTTRGMLLSNHVFMRFLR